MKETLALNNIDRMLHDMALSARGMVITGDATKEEILDHIREKGNEEITAIFNMKDGEVVRQMIIEVMGTFVREMEGE